MDYLAEVILVPDGATILSDIVLEVIYEYPEKFGVPRDMMGFH